MADINEDLTWPTVCHEKNTSKIWMLTYFGQRSRQMDR